MTLLCALFAAFSLPSFAAQRAAIPDVALPLSALSVPPAVGAAGIRLPEAGISASDPAAATDAKAGGAPSAEATVEALFQELGRAETPAQPLRAVFDGDVRSDTFASDFLPDLTARGTLDLSGLSANAPKRLRPEKALKKLAKDRQKLDKLEHRLTADRTRKVLVIIHGPNAAGKDGTIHDVFSGDPQIIKAVSFKKPSAEEVKHHPLWRIIKGLPTGKGLINLFNRSQYEDLVVPLVTPEKYASIWGFAPKGQDLKRRIAEINAFEKKLTEQGWTILKFYLHTTKDEQYRRLRERQLDPEKRWKLSSEDLEEHEQNWVATRHANERVIAATDKPWARWLVVPANDKWYRNYVIARIVKRALKSFDLKFPPAPDGLDKVVIKR